MSEQQVRGFTLLEMLLALAIVSALTLSAFQVLQSGMRADELSRNKVHRLAELQRAFSQMEQDFTQMIQRSARGSERMLLAAPHQLQSDDWGVTFTRNSWQNPLGMLPRSELQRVGYRLRHQQLERLSNFYVDQPSSVYPGVRVLLSSVEAFRLRFYANGTWRESWDSATQLPQGIEVTLVVDDFAQLTRLFLISEGSEQ
ncbi:type II secretion system minor pseudopilin GspJ [Escherichia coli]|uniref:type II secretion system minor pseudopilin GspJ n=1 Tax=Escherichia coli TaxID=562 RepID=UPI0004D95A6E|nr:type II secretion system minor pseudopilin GspJ [Escherichia coli]EFP6925852.1 type II secretion system minor pseudopilin GspJ [Shigella dysenteriae]EFQ0895392.1 type II secretion system minor pseudopilin GspJ [Shigella flexneri]EJF5752684.1 type II secretion system minor pseudopilin GspJ [Shigella sonnei]VTQ24996.1 PilD-dependent protein pddD [Streptococcus pneumoniae]EFC3980005.1 type II secretion system protein GspJ [Escherichia coli]